MVETHGWATPSSSRALRLARSFRVQALRRIRSEGADFVNEQLADIWAAAAGHCGAAEEKSSRENSRREKEHQRENSFVMCAMWGGVQRRHQWRVQQVVPLPRWNGPRRDAGL